MLRLMLNPNWNSKFLFFGLVVLSILSNCRNDEEVSLDSGAVTAENALDFYLNNEDSVYNWEVFDTYNMSQSIVHVLRLTSQRWREHTWVHQLTVIVPPQIEHDGAILLISGGSLSDGEPNWTGPNDEFAFFSSLVANKNNAIIAILSQVPNQPLYGGLKEDALISYTLHNFKADGDYSWPLLFPMVKSVSKAMDAVEEFSRQNLDLEINRFLLTGASKRGWTTWLSAAADERVVAIAPVVIDVLNMPAHIPYQLEVWKDYSPQIVDYVNLGIVQDLESGATNELAQMIDPYSYRNQLTMPKLIVIGTNDQYWPVDAVKHYIDEIPGENFLHYVPNAGHDLNNGEQSIFAISAFFDHALNRTSFPVLEWSIKPETQHISLKVNATAEKLVDAILWTAESDDRDFRDAVFRPTPLQAAKVNQVEATIDYPDSGFRAFYIDLKYLDLDGAEFTKSTRVFVADGDEVL